MSIIFINQVSVICPMSQILTENIIGILFLILKRNSDIFSMSSVCHNLLCMAWLMMINTGTSFPAYNFIASAFIMAVLHLLHRLSVQISLM